MKRHMIFGTAAVLIASIAVVGGYWWGFRQGARFGLMANAAPRGVVDVGLLRQLELGQTEYVRFYLESEVDSGLMWWHELDQFPLRPFLNTLSGSDVIPGNEKYVRKLATYRKAHPSPLDDPSLNQQVVERLRASDPAVANEFGEGDLTRRQAIQEMLQKYGK